MKKTGFAISSIIYSILILFLLLVFAILSILGSRKMVLDKLKTEVMNNLNEFSEVEKEYIDYSGANKPILFDKMIPVIYENNNWVYADIKEKWYDYDAKQWANAVVLNDNIVDQSPNNNYGIPYGTGKQLDSRYFDGIDDYINAGLVSYDFQNKITIAARFKIHRLNEDYNECIFGNWENAGGGIFMTASGHYISTSLFVGGSYRYLKSSTQIELNKYYTVVLTYDGSIIKLYIDGELEQTMEITGNIGISPTPFALGANPTVSSANGFSNTTISDAVLYTNALTQTQIKTHFSNKIGLVSDNLLLKYDFSNQQNIKVGDIVPMERIGTMWVWVPRYKYTIFNGNNESVSEQEINIVFERGTAKTGTVTCITATSGSGSSSETCTTITNGVSTYTHPAFTFGSKELTGIWIGKFENSTTDNSCNTNQNTDYCNKVLPVTIKPNVRSWRYANISSFYTSISNISSNYGMNVDSHMMKNMEWGAVAYLSHSKYGRCDNGNCTEISRNDSSYYYTGSSDGTNGSGTADSENGTYTYEIPLGWLASTTGNIYGIYDMSGGAVEYVMGNMVDSNGNFYSSSAGFSTNPSTKYYDAYSNNTSSTTFSRGKLGDATKETLKTYESTTGGWYNDITGFISSTNSWFDRGGFYVDDTSAGVFHFAGVNGASIGHRASRSVLVSDR